jgi:hypothetical protein
MWINERDFGDIKLMTCECSLHLLLKYITMHSLKLLYLPGILINLNLTYVLSVIIMYLIYIIVCCGYVKL